MLRITWFCCRASFPWAVAQIFLLSLLRVPLRSMPLSSSSEYRSFSRILFVFSEYRSFFRKSFVFQNIVRFSEYRSLFRISPRAMLIRMRNQSFSVVNPKERNNTAPNVARAAPLRSLLCQIESLFSSAPLVASPKSSLSSLRSLLLSFFSFAHDVNPKEKCPNEGKTRR